MLIALRSAMGLGKVRFGALDMPPQPPVKAVIPHVRSVDEGDTFASSRREEEDRFFTRDRGVQYHIDSHNPEFDRDYASIVTYNVDGLRYPDELPPGKILTKAETEAREAQLARIEKIKASLVKSNGDVICLQEVYSASDIKRLVDEAPDLKLRYKNLIFFGEQTVTQKSGMAVLIRDGLGVQIPKAYQVSRAPRPVGIIPIETAKGEWAFIMAVHLKSSKNAHAFLRSDWQSPEEINRDTVTQAVNYLHQKILPKYGIKPEDAKVIMAGDFNTGDPEFIDYVNHLLGAARMTPFRMTHISHTQIDHVLGANVAPIPEPRSNTVSPDDFQASPHRLVRAFLNLHPSAQELAKAHQPKQEPQELREARQKFSIRPLRPFQAIA